MSVYQHIDKVMSDIGHEVELISFKVELSQLGVPAVRALLGFASPMNSVARTQALVSEVQDIYMWLNTAFDTEYKRKSAAVFESARQLGLKFIPDTEISEVQDYYYEMMSKLAIAKQHLELEQTGVPPFSEDRYSVFAEAMPTLDFDTIIEGE